MEYAIKADHIGHRFGGKSVLKALNLKVGYGEIFGLLGPSGAGKTTLIKILTGQLRATEGTASLFGRETGTLTGADYGEIGIMMDCFGLYERLSCYENLKIFANIYGIAGKKNRREKIERMLDSVGLLASKNTDAMKLSKGMRSRLLLARALLGEPKALFLDEPTSGLDPVTAEEIHRLIEAERQAGVTVFLTTHHMAEAEKLCSRIALLHNGEIVESGSPGEICRRYNHQKKILLHLYDGTDLTLPHDAEAAETIERCLRNGEIETIHSSEPDLETVFMELTGRKLV